MRTKSLIAFLFFIFISQYNYGQINLSYEAGINIGASSFQTDYGERYDLESGLYGNMGVATGATFYINFFTPLRLWNDRTTWFNTHFKVKSEVSYIGAKLQHFGQYVESNSQAAEQLKAMHGKASVISTGLTLEYHINDLFNYSNNRYYKFDPFVGIGTLASFSKPTFEYDLGDYQADPSILYPKYQSNAIFTDPKTTASFVLSGGTRIKGGDKGDFIFEGRWQYFLSNKIDALDPPDNSNKYNDWAFSLTAGYVFYLY